MQGADRIPAKFIPFVTQTKSHHPTWRYILWDELSILNFIKPNALLFDTYYKFEYLHQKIDFARYVIMYIYGGVFVDMDAYAIKPLDPLLTQYESYPLIISAINRGYIERLVTPVVNNAIIISKPGSKALLKLINTIISNPKCKQYQSKFYCIQRTTGPYAFWDALEPFKNTPELLILEPDYLEPCVSTVCNETENTYIKHEHEMSWVSDTSKTFTQFCARNKLLINLFAGIIFLLIIYGLFQFLSGKIKSSP
jgi:mannosyltransferase OCH1-like enzyme